MSIYHLLLKLNLILAESGADYYSYVFNVRLKSRA